MTCLSIGNTISTLCAVSEARTVGLIEPADNTLTENGSAKKRQKRSDGARVVKFMGIPISIREEAFIICGKSKPLKDCYLKHKFGDEQQYNAIRVPFEGSLQTWSGYEYELYSKAFHM
jgi:hypothetical protein